MTEKKHLHECDLAGSLYDKRITKMSGTLLPGTKDREKDMRKVYNKFYKDQIDAIYKSIHNGK
ncbi:MAG: hypothetical protein HQL30_01630 [Candidatus Omnitrophica bacterium]|nr:hypothetical protein [Candidatus Omnitrophota bacterium]